MPGAHAGQWGLASCISVSLASGSKAAALMGPRHNPSFLSARCPQCPVLVSMMTPLRWLAWALQGGGMVLPSCPVPFLSSVSLPGAGAGAGPGGGLGCLPSMYPQASQVGGRAILGISPGEAIVTVRVRPHTLPALWGGPRKPENSCTAVKCSSPHKHI